MNNVFFDTCVYHRPGIELLTSVIDPGNILFASEMLGAVRGDNPDGGFPWDDTKRYLDKASLPEEDRGKIFELNARRVYPRLDMRLKAAELTGRADGSCCALAWHAETTIEPGRSSTARSGRWGSSSPACR